MGVKVRERPQGSGIWWIFIDHQGKRKAKKVGKNKKAAIEAAGLIEAKLKLGDLGLMNKEENTMPLFKDYAALWLNNYIQGVRRSATYERYNGLLEKYILPVLSKTPLDQVKRSDVKALLVSLYKNGQSKSSVALVRNVISSMMTQAVDEELLQANPATGILKQLKLDSTKRITVEPMNAEEVAIFLSTCQEGYAEYYSFFLTAFRTGLRLGELLGLQWGDIDWNRRFIQVRRTYKRGQTGPTKSGKERRVDMSDQLIAELKRYRIARKEEAFREGKGDAIGETVFTIHGEQMEQNYIRRVYNRILTSAGIRHLRIHDIRHTYASLLLSNGSSLMYVKEQMGHHSIQITVDTYGHLLPNGNRTEVNSLDAICSPATIRNPDATTENRKTASL